MDVMLCSLGLFVPLGDIVMLRGSNELCNLSHSVLVSFRERERKKIECEDV